MLGTCRRIWPLLIMITLLAPGVLAGVELRILDPAHAPRPGEAVTWKLVAPPAEWLQHDVARTPYVIITEADGRRYRRESFLTRPYRIDPQQSRGEFQATGEQHLQLRHSPRVGGRMLWTLHAPGSADYAEPLAQGQVDVLPGPVVSAIAPWSENRRLLQDPTGKPLPLIGVNIAWAVDHDRDRLATIIAYMDRFAQRGGNHIRLWCASWFGNISSATAKRWRLDQAWLLDATLQAARDRGLMVTLVLDNHTDFLNNSHMPYPEDLAERQQAFFSAELSDSYQARLRYMLARYAHYDHLVAWEVFNEIDLTEAADDALVQWSEAALDFLAEHDPYQRLRSISWIRERWPEMLAIESLTLLQIHRYIPHLERLEASDSDIISTMIGDVMHLREAKRPFIFMEVGHHGHDDSDVPGNDLDHSGVALLQKSWAGLLLGGAGTGMSWWWDSWLQDNDLWRLYQPMERALSLINWADAGLRPMHVDLAQDMRILGWQSSRQAVIWPHSRWSSWHNQLLQPGNNRHLGRRFAVSLQGMSADRRYSQLAIHMRSGAVVSAQTLHSSADGQLRLQLPPYDGAIVIVVIPQP